jgi:hypothetical protein
VRPSRFASTLLARLTVSEGQRERVDEAEQLERVANEQRVIPGPELLLRLLEPKRTPLDIALEKLPDKLRVPVRAWLADENMKTAAKRAGVTYTTFIARRDVGLQRLQWLPQLRGIDVLQALKDQGPPARKKPAAKKTKKPASEGGGQYLTGSRFKQLQAQAMAKRSAEDRAQIKKARAEYMADRKDVLRIVEAPTREARSAHSADQADSDSEGEEATQPTAHLADTGALPPREAPLVELLEHRERFGGLKNRPFKDVQYIAPRRAAARYRAKLLAQVESIRARKGEAAAAEFRGNVELLSGRKAHARQARFFKALGLKSDGQPYHKSKTVPTRRGEP